MKVIENQPAPWTGFLLPPIEVIVMRLCVATLLAAVVSSGLPGKANADDGAKAILDKAIKALGGEEKLKSVQAFTWTANASIKANRKVSDSVFLVTFQGLDHVRRDFRTRAPYRVLMSGDKGWHTAGGQYRPMTKEALERQKRMTYLQVASTLLVPLKSPGFKYEAAGEEEVRGKPALILKVTGPDGKDFTISFDKESFLPVKEVAHSPGPEGQDQVEETLFSGYKEIDGIKKATVIETRTDADTYGYIDITEFRVLDQVSAKMFVPPE